ncbi:MAG: hypothetical protein ABEI86_05570, partial [Halobacteriaceae archaeon]
VSVVISTAIIVGSIVQIGIPEATSRLISGTQSDIKKGEITGSAISFAVPVAAISAYALILALPVIGDQFGLDV